jgi:hypothetical protein
MNWRSATVQKTTMSLYRSYANENGQVSLSALLLLTNKQADAVFFLFDDERGRRGVVLYCLCKFAGRTDVSSLKYYYVLIYDVLLLTGRPCPFGV